MEEVFARLLGRKPAPAPAVVDPLVAFSQAWEQVKSALEHPDERMLSRGIGSTAVPRQLQVMVDALVFESNETDDSTTGACLEFLLKNDVLSTLERLADGDRPFGIKAEVLNVFNLLVALLDERFLVHNAVHRPLRRLMRSCVGDDPEELLDGKAKVVGAAAKSGGSDPTDYEKDLLELMCMLTKRIRSYPSLLAVFFHDKSFHRPHAPEGAASPASEDLALADLLSRTTSPIPSQAPTSLSSQPGSPAQGEPKKDLEFLLFSYLLRFVHRESPIGEFARAGIMFLIDVAFSPGEDRGIPDPLADTKQLLGEYMLEGDFADVLGAALGAAYSLLPSKLLVRQEARDEPATGGGMMLGGASTYEDNVLQELAEPSTSANFRSTLDIFLKFLEFLQDVIKRGTSSSSSPALDTPDANLSLTPQTLIGASLAHAILQAVRTTFLDHVLYPNILECSDQDGSVIAVLSYIDTILSTLTRDGPLALVILDFLIGKDDGDLRAPAAPVVSQAVKHSRRKSSAMILLENMKIPKSSQYSSQGRFTLRDLVLDNVTSRNPSTATAALRLIHTVLGEYPHVALHNIFASVPDPTNTLVPFTLPPLSFSLDDDSATSSRPGSPESDIFVYAEPVQKAAELPVPTPLSLPDWILPEPSTTMTTHTREVDLYLGLVREIGGSLSTDQPPNYKSYLQDAVAALEASPSLTAFQMSLLSVGAQPASDQERPGTPPSRTSMLDPSDKLLQRTLNRLREFFVHTPEENLALTGVLASVAICSELSLEGWLAFTRDESADDPWTKADEQGQSAEAVRAMKDEDEDEDDHAFFRSVAPVIQRKLSDGDPFREFDQSETQPVLLTLFENLVRKLERYRMLVPEFDKYLGERRQGLFFEDNLSDLLMDVQVTPFGDAFVSATQTSPNDATTRPFRTPTHSRSGSLTSPATALSPLPTTPRPKAKSKWSFLSPRKTPTVSPAIDPASAVPYQVRQTKDGQSLPTTPNAAHYEATGSLKVESLVAESPRRGVWSPSVARAHGSLREADENDESDDEGARQEPEQVETRQISLSQVLDNVVILEECLKELVAIRVARLACGVDTLSYA